MSVDDPGDGQPPPPAPLTVPGQRPPPPPAWPAVLGVICVVLGACGTLTNLCGSILYPFIPQLVRNLPQTPGQDKTIVDIQMQMMQKYMLFSVPATVAAAGASIMLLVGGIGLLKRRPWCVRTLNGWAVLRMVVAVAATVLALIISAETMSAVKDAAAHSSGSSSSPAGMQSFAMSMGQVGAVIAFLWGCALPIFVLIWFRRAAIRAQVDAWRMVGPSPLPRRGGSST